MEVEKTAAGISIVDGYIDFKEISEPSNPPANTARLCCKDNGSGKSQWGLLFSTGSFIVLATQA